MTLKVSAGNFSDPSGGMACGTWLHSNLGGLAGCSFRYSRGGPGTGKLQAAHLFGALTFEAAEERGQGAVDSCF